MATHGVPVGPFPPDADPDAYDRLRRRVLWRLPMGLYLLGSAAGDRRNLMTINWAMQVSTQPKHVAVSIETSAVTHGLVVEGRCFSLSLIDREDRAEVRKFVKPAIEHADTQTLSGIRYRTGVTGAPIPALAVGWLDCELREHLEVGSHTLFVGEVVDAGFVAGGEETAVLRMEDTRMSYGG
jgi:flavin reductase (DIM6/NTAB) family NADH-FMN oxidoreductase RutF